VNFEFRLTICFYVKSRKTTRKTSRVLIFLSKVSMLVSISLSRRSSKRPWLWLSWWMSIQVDAHSHSCPPCSLVLPNKWRVFPSLFLPPRCAMFNRETKAKTGQWALLRFLPEIKLVKRACEKRKWKNIEVSSYKGREKNRFTCKSLKSLESLKTHSQIHFF